MSVRDYAKWDSAGLRKRKQFLTKQYHAHTAMAANSKQLWEYHKDRAANIDREIARIERALKARAK